jgi:hypothetical protein
MVSLPRPSDSTVGLDARKYWTNKLRWDYFAECAKRRDHIIARIMEG